MAKKKTTKKESAFNKALVKNLALVSAGAAGIGLVAKAGADMREKQVKSQIIADILEQEKSR